MRTQYEGGNDTKDKAAWTKAKKSARTVNGIAIVDDLIQGRIDTGEIDSYPEGFLPDRDTLISWISHSIQTLQSREAEGTGMIIV